MCLQIIGFSNRANARKRKPRIAQEDIVVYKKLHPKADGSFRAPFFPDFEYKPNRTYRCKEFGKTWYESTVRHEHCKLLINAGLHAKTNRREFFIWNNEIVVEMIIPKGTPYYLSNYNSDIVALKLRTPKQF